MQLRTLCDSVLHTYLSKVADTAEKRNYLHALYTVVDGSTLEHSPAMLLEGHTLRNMVLILGLYPPAFRPWEDHDLLFIATRGHLYPSMMNFLKSFVRNPERSRSFYCDPELWSTLVATRCIRYLRTEFSESLDPR